MQRLKILGLASTVILALSLIAGVATASAAPEFVLAEGSFPVSFTGAGGAGSLETIEKSAIKCAKSSSSGEIKNATDGELTITFDECELSSVACKGVGRSAGVILTEGLTTLVDTNLSPVGAGLLVEQKELTVECGSLVKVVVHGGFLIPLEPVDITASLYEGLLTQTTGKPLFATYWNSSGEEKKALLQASISGGSAKEAAYAVASPTLTFSKEVEIRTGTLAETDPVRVRRVGGTDGGTEHLCLFTALNQVCEIAIENISAGEIEVRDQDVAERVTNVHYKESYVKRVSVEKECYGASFFGWIKGIELLAGTFCRIDLKATRMPTLPSEVQGGYSVSVRAAGTTAGSSIPFTARE